MRLTEKQVKFCNFYVGGKDATNAYSIAFNNNKLSSAKVCACILLKQEKIKLEVKRLQEENRIITENANKKASDNLSNGEVASKVDRLKLLTKIMNGESTKENPISMQDRIRAIAELNKMGGDYAPQKSEHNIKSTGNELHHLTIIPASLDQKNGNGHKT